jgi:hypothetical protein
MVQIGAPQGVSKLTRKDISTVDDGGNPSHSPYNTVRREARTFAAFLDSDACRDLIDDEVRVRLKQTGSNVKTVTLLKNWARERYPADYPGQGWRIDTSERPNGKEAMARLWSAFRTWAEADA